jgi:hypothetical protein
MIIRAKQTYIKQIHNPQRMVQGVRVLNENIVQVISKEADANFLDTPGEKNIFIALIPTSWAIGFACTMNYGKLGVAG